jgi:hypothetical protein
MKEEERDGVSERGFKFSPGRVRRDGAILPPIKDAYIPGDPDIPRIISWLFGHP